MELLLNKSLNFPGITPAPFDKSRGEFTNVYRSPYPLLPSQIGPGGAITRPFSASFLPTLFPLSESTHPASSSAPSNHRPVPPMRYHSQHRRAPVYYPPTLATIRPTRSGTSLLLPIISPPTTPFGSSPGNKFSSTILPVSVVSEPPTLSGNY